jgi:hypothetical protein
MSTNKYCAILSYFKKFFYVLKGLGTTFQPEVPLNDLLPMCSNIMMQIV